MATEIRGSPDAQTQMVLGQIRQIFDPMWIQDLDTSEEFIVSFVDNDKDIGDLIRFAEMYGYELSRSDTEAGWGDYYFE